MSSATQVLHMGGKMSAFGLASSQTLHQLPGPGCPHVRQAILLAGVGGTKADAYAKKAARADFSLRHSSRVGL